MAWDNSLEDGKGDDGKKGTKHKNGREMGKETGKETKKTVLVILVILVGCGCLSFCGCKAAGGYSNETLFTDKVSSVYLEMFDSRSLRRGVEYELTDALGITHVFDIGRICDDYIGP